MSYNVHIDLSRNHVFVLLQNIRVMAKYYTRVQMKRMAELLDLTEAVSSAASFVFHYSCPVEKMNGW